MTRTHRAPMTGYGPMPCCGRTPTEVDPDDRITGTGDLTCLGVIALPGPSGGDLAALVASVPWPHRGRPGPGYGRRRVLSDA